MSSWGGKYDKSDDPESEWDCSDKVGVDAPSESIYGECTNIALRSIFSKSRSEGVKGFAAEVSIDLSRGAESLLRPSTTGTLWTNAVYDICKDDDCTERLGAV